VIPGFGIKKGSKRQRKRRQGDNEVALLISWSNVHGLGAFLVIPTKNSELQSISPPSFRSSQLSYRNSSHKLFYQNSSSDCLTNPQLNFSWTAELLESRLLGGSSFFCINMEALALDRLLNLSVYHYNFEAVQFRSFAVSQFGMTSNYE